jgi:tRNA pseudouridine55 synthase
MFYYIDKPLGLTSYDVIRKLKKILWTTRIGHTGTLDPLATWGLLIATHQSTKLIPYIDKTEKTYRFMVDISGKSASLDMGTPIEWCTIDTYLDRSKEELIDFLSSQTEQIPPNYSALHVDGKRAYERVRDGEDFTLQSRSIRVKDVIIHRLELPILDIELTISSGGYIRSFAPVIGTFFWSSGGYIRELRRTAIHLGENHALNIETAQPLDSFDPEKYIKYSELFPEIPTQNIDEETYTKLIQWKIIGLPWIQYNIWQKLFLKYMDNFISLVQYTGDGLQIIRNDV